MPDSVFPAFGSRAEKREVVPAKGAKGQSLTHHTLPRARPPSTESLVARLQCSTSKEQKSLCYKATKSREGKAGKPLQLSEHPAVCLGAAQLQELYLVNL